MALLFDHVNNDISADVGLITPTIGEGLIDPVEIQDVAGLTSYDLSHTMEAGYVYYVMGRGFSSVTTGWSVYVRFRNDAGTWITTPSSTEISYQVVANSGIRDNANTVMVPYYIGFVGDTGIANTRDLNWSMTIFNAMDVDTETSVIMDSGLYGNAVNERGYASGSMVTIDGHDKYRIYTPSGSFDAGEVLTYRWSEPTA